MRIAVVTAAERSLHGPIDAASRRRTHARTLPAASSMNDAAASRSTSVALFTLPTRHTPRLASGTTELGNTRVVIIGRRAQCRRDADPSPAAPVTGSSERQRSADRQPNTASDRLRADAFDVERDACAKRRQRRILAQHPFEHYGLGARVRFVPLGERRSIRRVPRQ